MADFGTIQFQEAEALRKLVEELKAALRPFADAWFAGHYEVDSEHWERAHALTERKD